MVALPTFLREGEHPRELIPLSLASFMSLSSLLSLTSLETAREDARPPIRPSDQLAAREDARRRHAARGDEENNHEW